MKHHTFESTKQTDTRKKMFKQLATTFLLAVCSLGMQAQNTTQKNIYKLIKDTYETKADSTTNAFIETFMNKSKGIFDVSYKHYAFNAYWTQAHYIDVLIYNYQRHKGIDSKLANTYLNYIKLWYKNKANNYMGAGASSTTTPNTTTDYRMFENNYTDDMCWITLTLLHIAEATGTSSYATVAKQVFDNYIIKRGIEDEATGGIKLPWSYDNEKNRNSFNACTQSPATLIAAKLYQRYGHLSSGAKYLEYAKKLYAYTAKKIVFADYRVEDPPLTYTQGTFAEACRILYHVTDETTTIKNKYRTLAYQYHNYAYTSGRCTNGSNILRDEGSSGDQSVFKAVLIPYTVNFILDEDMVSAYRTTIFKLLLKNTETCWKNLDMSAYPKVFCATSWTKSKPFEDVEESGSAGAMCSGASLIENTARLCRVMKDRYELGALLTECEKLDIDSTTLADTPELANYKSALKKAQDINETPGDFTISDFKKAIENLQAGYQEAMDYIEARSIASIGIDPKENTTGVYDMSGKLVRTPWQRTDNLKSGMYIVNGKKVLIP